MPTAGKPIPITAYVLPNAAPVGSVQLTYLVNYGSPVNLPMTATTGVCRHLIRPCNLSVACLRVCNEHILDHVHSQDSR